MVNSPNLDENGEVIVGSGTIPLRFMQLPYLPCISRFEGEDHPLKIVVNNIPINRVRDISNLNRYFKSQNDQAEPKKSKPVPSMKYAGISLKSFGRHPPAGAKHLFSQWVGPSRHAANNMVHVVPKHRLPYWRSVHEFFNPGD